MPYRENAFDRRVRQKLPSEDERRQEDEKKLIEEKKRLIEEGKNWELRDDKSFVITWRESGVIRSINFLADSSIKHVGDGIGGFSEKDLADAEIAYKIATIESEKGRLEEVHRKAATSKDAMTARMLQEEEDAKAISAALPQSTAVPISSRRASRGHIGRFLFG